MTSKYLTMLIVCFLLSETKQQARANFFSRTIKSASVDQHAQAKPNANIVHLPNEHPSTDDSSPTRQNDSAKQPAPSGATSAMGSEAQVGSIITFEEGVLYAHLANNNKIPLVGLGVGNSPHEFIGALIHEAVQDDNLVRLIDTAHASQNEHLVAEGIISGIQELVGKRHYHQLLEEATQVAHKIEVHVVTKVWYTHLGYERTKISVEESIEALRPALEHPNVTLKLHVLLHWPRCYDNITWMKCQEEEANLPPHVKEAGPDPTLRPDDAWKDSWKALEDMYLSDQYPIASIGVSNFHLHEIETMDSFARIHPHVLQANIWSLLYDSPLLDHCHKRRIHVQVYNAIAGTLVQPDIAPRAYHHLQKVAGELTAEIKNLMDVTPAQVILAWLIQHGVSVIPRTSKFSRLQENSARSLAAIPGMTDLQVETVAHAVEAYLSQDDLAQDIHVTVSFHAVSKDMMLYWRGPNGDEIRIAHVKQGESFHETTYPNHVFRTYDASNKDIFVEHHIEADFGEHKHIHVEL